MNRHLLLLTAVFVLLVSWLNNFRHYMLIWIAHHRSKSSLAKGRRKNKSRPYLSPTRRPECPLCQPEKVGNSNEDRSNMSIRSSMDWEGRFYGLFRERFSRLLIPLSH